MNCLEYRRAVGAEPHRADAELDAHARGCAACSEYTEQMRRLDARIESALRIPVPLWSSVETVRERWTRAPLALAASLMLAVAVASILWMLMPRTSIAADVIAHMQHEPDAMATTEPIPESAVAYVLERAGLKVHLSPGSVTYAQSCLVRGHFVPHLVMNEGRGPVTVLLLAHEKVDREEHFSEGGYTGVIFPAPRGAIAVLTRDESQVEAIARRLAGSLQ